MLNKLVLPLILLYVSVVLSKKKAPDFDESDNPFRDGVIDNGVREMVVGDDSELRRREKGEMPPINPDGTVPKGFELYETFRDFEHLRSKIPFEKYVESGEQMQLRGPARNKINKKVHIYYEDSCPNLVELSDEVYETYIVNSTTGKLINNTHFYLIASFHKNVKDNALFASDLQELSEELNQTFPHKYHFAYIDKNVDVRLYYTFNARAEPSVYLIDPTTGKAYAMDNSYNKTAPGVVKNWILSGDYKKSYHSFKAPVLITDSSLGYQRWFTNIETMYMATIGIPINRKLLSLGSTALSFPINLFFTDNYTKDDQFGWTIFRQIKLVFLIISIISWINLTLFRMVCCRKYKYVQKKKQNKVKDE